MDSILKSTMSNYITDINKKIYDLLFNFLKEYVNILQDID